MPPRAKKRPRLVHEESDDGVETVPPSPPSTSTAFPPSRPEHAQNVILAGKGHEYTDYHHFTPEEVHQLHVGLLQWFDVTKRTLPWRKPTPVKDVSMDVAGQRAYEVWVSEVMLQQTQVATVIPYYTKWMENWPTIKDLASADIEDINKVWAGLGYYSRAQRLLEAAKHVLKRLKGHLPRTVKQLMEIPGIGRYTAGAVASIAYGVRAPVVDGNVNRVLSRLRAIGADQKDKKMTDLLWKLASDIVDPERPGDFNQALMDVILCSLLPFIKHASLDPWFVLPQSHPVIDAPLNLSVMLLASFKTQSKSIDVKENEMCVKKPCTICYEWDEEISAALIPYPIKKKKTAVREGHSMAYIFEYESKYLLIQRPKKGLLGGLWAFPQYDLDSPLDEHQRIAILKDHLLARWEMTDDNFRSWSSMGQVLHIFSHIRQMYYVEHIQLKQPILSKKVGMKWVTADEVDKIGIPTAMKKVYKLFRG